jgi:sRNA-binding regulator protein Hfq
MKLWGIYLKKFNDIFKWKIKWRSNENEYYVLNGISIKGEIEKNEFCW